MENQTPNTATSRTAKWFKTSNTVKMVGVLVMMLLLLIPLSFVENLIWEREHTQNNVIEEINSKWGNSVRLYGPILKVPYKTYEDIVVYNKKHVKTGIKRTTEINYAFFLPNELDYSAKVESKSKKRNNYETVVFTTDIAIHGNFTKPDFKVKDIPEKDILWNKATILVKTSNLKGLKTNVATVFNEVTYPLETKLNNYSNENRKNATHTLESQYIKKEQLNFSEPIPFKMDVSYNGSESISFVPIGKKTTAEMVSNWKNPSFTGDFLPQNEGEKVTKEGFKANWSIMSINRSFSQSFFNKLPYLEDFAFGTKLIVLADEYQKITRASKYGFLVIGLTFLIFFLIQTLSNINIHAFQYTMIGIALIMFYTLLVSISEHSSFLKAYVIAGIAVISLISLYSKAILKDKRFMLLIAASLTALYSFIYVIIQLESYALLVGSIGLFIILSIVMYVSRKIEWHSKSV